MKRVGFKLAAMEHWRESKAGKLTDHHPSMEIQCNLLFKVTILKKKATAEIHLIAPSIFQILLFQNLINILKL